MRRQDERLFETGHYTDLHAELVALVRLAVG
jgi:hypothetical protein